MEEKGNGENVGLGIFLNSHLLDRYRDDRGIWQMLLLVLHFCEDGQDRLDCWKKKLLCDEVKGRNAWHFKIFGLRKKSILALGR